MVEGELFCVNNTNECNIFKENLDQSNSDILERKCKIYGGLLENESKFKKLCWDAPINLQENNIKILKDRDIIDALKNDHLNRLVKLLCESNRMNENIDISIDYNYSGNTLLHEAIFWNSNKCIMYLLKQCSGMIHTTNKDGNTVLHIACLKGNSFLINELHNLGSDISAINKRKETILHCAIKSGIYEVVDNVYKIINNDHCLSCSDEKGRNALHIAVICKNNNYDIIHFLIKKGSQIVNRDYTSCTIMTNLNKLEKNERNLRIKTLLTKSFYDIYKQKTTTDDGIFTNTFESKFYKNNINKGDTCFKSSLNNSNKAIDLYSYKLCNYPEYAPFILETNRPTTYNTINTYNVNYNKDERYLLKERNPIKKKVLPIKFKTDFEDFENFGNFEYNIPESTINKPITENSKKLVHGIISLGVIGFLFSFLFMYE